jgi:2-haloacid dehalogenase
MDSIAPQYWRPDFPAPISRLPNPLLEETQQMSTNPNIREKDKWPAGKPSVLIFDVNETLIDFESMHPLFERVFGDKRAMREWLSNLIMYSMTITLSGLYKDYWAIGGGCFEMVGEIHGIDIKPDDTEALRQAMKTMPAHRDSEEGLSLLKDAGFRMVTLTNSPPTPGSKSPLENAGLSQFFEKQYNIEACRAYKPHQLVYHYVAQDLDVAPADCCMVATHVWDTIGGQAAGMAGGLVTRPGNALLPILGLPQPNALGSTLPELARDMIRQWR